MANIMKLHLTAALALALASGLPADADGTSIRGGATPAPSAGTGCGADGSDTCLPFAAVKSYAQLDACLAQAFPTGRNDTVAFIRYNDGSGKDVVKITDPTSGEDYADARYLDSGKLPGYEDFAAYSNEVRWPAVIIYAETEDEVVDAVNCAVGAGYKIAPRGRGHSYRALSLMDGYVVIDVSPMCHPDEFVLSREVDDWLLPGQKRIGKIKNGPGCTNAVMLGYTHKHFGPEEGGLYAIGSCPSVGIVGYSTGGGSGDATPWIGWGVDDVLEVDMVLYDGTKVTANEEENADLFWAVRGGGSGLGVITSMTTAVVQSPEPTSGERKFLQFRLYYKHDDGKRKTFLDLVQKFLYESPDSPRYGGGGGFGDEESHLQGIFLGSIDDFLDIFGDAGLLDANLLDETKPTDCLSNYEVCEYPDDLPTFGLKVRHFESYGEAILTNICMAKVEAPATNLLMISLSEGLSWCKDLGISEDKCFDVAVPVAPGVPDIPMRLPDCDDPDVISAFADAAIDPISFMNRQGPFAVGAGGTGGLLLPRLEVDLFNQLAKEVGLGVNHLQHGAAMSKSTSDTAYPWRDTALLIEPAGPTGSDDLTKIANVLATQHYEDGSKLQGYYNYMNPPGNPNWKYYYFGDNYERLSQIKAKYDPLNYFGNPYQVEPAVDVASSPSIDENGSKISAIS